MNPTDPRAMLRTVLVAIRNRIPDWLPHVQCLTAGIAALDAIPSPEPVSSWPECSYSLTTPKPCPLHPSSGQGDPVAVMDAHLGDLFSERLNNYDKHDPLRWMNKGGVALGWQQLDEIEDAWPAVKAEIARLQAAQVAPPLGELGAAMEKLRKELHSGRARDLYTIFQAATSVLAAYDNIRNRSETPNESDRAGATGTGAANGPDREARQDGAGDANAVSGAHVEAERDQSEARRFGRTDRIARMREPSDREHVKPCQTPIAATPRMMGSDQPASGAPANPIADTNAPAKGSARATAAMNVGAKPATSEATDTAPPPQSLGQIEEPAEVKAWREAAAGKLQAVEMIGRVEEVIDVGNRLAAALVESHRDRAAWIRAWSSDTNRLLNQRNQAEQEAARLRGVVESERAHSDRIIGAIRFANLGGESLAAVAAHDERRRQEEAGKP